jgi:hypothetical protein
MMKMILPAVPWDRMRLFNERSPERPLIAPP